MKKALSLWCDFCVFTHFVSSFSSVRPLLFVLRGYLSFSCHFLHVSASRVVLSGSRRPPLSGGSPPLGWCVRMSYSSISGSHLGFFAKNCSHLPIPLLPSPLTRSSVLSMNPLSKYYWTTVSRLPPPHFILFSYPLLLITLSLFPWYLYRFQIQYHLFDDVWFSQILNIGVFLSVFL